MNPDAQSHFLASVFRVAPVGIGVVRERVFVEVNDLFCGMSGYRREELVGSSSRMLYEDEASYLATGREEERQIAESGTASVLIALRRRDGELIQVAVNSTPINPEDPDQGVTFTAQDLTDWHAAQARLQESEERFRALHNASFGGIAIHDEGLILECNMGLATMSGYTYEELIGCNGLDLIHEEDRATVIGNIRDGVQEPYEVRARHKSGDWFPVRLEARNIPYRGKQVRVVEFRDLTEIKKAEQQQAELQEQFLQSQKMEAVGQLAGGIAHDFNNLLQVILGYGEVVQEHARGDEKLHNAVTQIQKASQRARVLVSQLLAFSRRQIMQVELLDLNEAVAELLQMLRRVIGANIELRLIPGADLPAIKGDPNQIHQILANLAVNARDALPDSGGTITIATTVVRLDEAACRHRPGTPPGEYVELLFQDDGVGMDSATRDQIFEPFFTTKEVGAGTGLGLSTVYGLVKQHGAYIHCDSAPGAGTTFRILFPPVAEPAPAEEPPTTSTPAPGRGTILLAEDDEMVSELNQFILERNGYEVVVAKDGQQAWELFQARPDRFAAVLLDLVMPGLSGRQVYEMIREMKPKMPVLLTSGYSLEAIKNDKVWEEGLVLLRKPVTKDELLRALADVLTD